MRALTEVKHLELRPGIPQITFFSRPVPARLVPEMSRDFSAGREEARVSRKATGSFSLPLDL